MQFIRYKTPSADVRVTVFLRPTGRRSAKASALRKRFTKNLKWNRGGCLDLSGTKLPVVAGQTPRRQARLLILDCRLIGDLSVLERQLRVALLEREDFRECERGHSQRLHPIARPC